MNRRSRRPDAAHDAAQPGFSVLALDVREVWSGGAPEATTQENEDLTRGMTEELRQDVFEWWAWLADGISDV